MSIRSKLRIIETAGGVVQWGNCPFGLRDTGVGRNQSDRFKNQKLEISHVQLQCPWADYFAVERGVTPRLASQPHGPCPAGILWSAMRVLYLSSPLTGKRAFWQCQKALFFSQLRFESCLPHLSKSDSNLVNLIYLGVRHFDLLPCNLTLIQR